VFHQQGHERRLKVKKTRAAAALVLALAATVCGASGSPEPRFGGRVTVIGSGRPAVENRSVESFRGISLEGPGQVLLTIGSPRSVSVSCDDNLLPLVRTEVSGGTLRLGLVSGSSVNTATPFVFRVTAPSIDGLSLGGSGDIVVLGTIRADRLAVSIGGSGSIRAGIAVEELSAVISGSGDIDLAGRADRQQVRISGSGSYRARELQTAIARVEVDGSGSAELFVRGELSAAIHGSGSVTYRGGARATVQDSGSGSVRAE
jgi:hypothetical protein